MESSINMTRNQDQRANSQVRGGQLIGENHADYATFRNDPTGQSRPSSDLSDKYRREDTYQDLQKRRESLNRATGELIRTDERLSMSPIPTDLDEIHIKARLIEEKKKKIDKEIEKRIQDENDRRKRLASQGENMRKSIEKQGE